VERAKAASWWDNTLLIIVADHGSPYPAVGSPLASAPEQYRIPMLWLGGSLAVRDTVIHHIASQTDIAKTLLGQLGLTSRVYKWGIDILAPGARSFAFYSFSNGFGYVDSSGSYVFDNVEKGIIHKTGNPSTSSVRAGRAFQQMVMQEYVDLSAPHGH
jgi:phosphoglycerol transferase MdoB-like AlkP superfamily enzyme